MNLIDEVIRSLGGPWLVFVLLFVEGLIGVVALRNTRRECAVRALRSEQTVAAVWACFFLHSVVIVVASRLSLWELPIALQGARIAGTLAAVLGLTFAMAGFWEFRSLQRMSGLSADHLVTTGIYRFSRNPQNLGWGLLLLGIALAGRSGLGCLLALGYWVVFRHYVQMEEKHLGWVFSAKWDRYALQTPRFFSAASLWKTPRGKTARASAAESKTAWKLNARRKTEPLRSGD